MRSRSAARGYEGIVTMKIVFFGTSNVALPILEMLHQHHDVPAIVTQPDAVVGRNKELSESPVSVLANEMEIPLFKPQQVKGNDQFFEQLKKIEADIFIVVSYGKILPAEIIVLPKFKTLNIHFSILPKYRGASPIQAALLNGDTQTGTSIMVMDELLDHGPILATEQCAIDIDDNYVTLSQKLAHISANLLKKVLPRYAANEINPVEQDHSQATVTKIIKKQDGCVNWDFPAQHIYNQFRAYFPWPGIWTTWNNKVLKILDCLPVNGIDSALPPGSILADGVVVCGNASGLKILKLQLEGKNETDSKSFLNGYPNFVGSQLQYQAPGIISK